MKPQSWRKLPRNVWAVTLTSFLTDISSEMIFNLIPLFLANVLGVSTSIIGLIDGAAETTASLLKIASGWLSDKLGRRKNLTVAGYSLSAVAKVFLYFANVWTLVFAVRLSDRIGKGIRTSPRDALIADSIDPERRGMAFGLHRAGDTAGAVLGLVIALIIVSVSQSDALALDRQTFQLLVLMSVIPAFLAVAVLIFGVHEPKPQAATSDEKRMTHRWGDLSPQFHWFLAIVVLFTLGNSSDAFIILRAQERGLSVTGVLGVLIAFNLVYALLSGPAGNLSDKVGRKKLLVGGWLIYSVVYLGFALSQSIQHVIILYVFYGVYYACAEGTAKAFVADMVPKEQRGTAYGFYNGAVGLTMLPASLMAGFLWEYISPSAPFLMGATLAFVAVGLLLFWKK